MGGIMRAILQGLGLCAVLAGMAQANDGFGGISATGLTFGQTNAVAMVEEDLFIGIDRISVDYLFRNTSAQDVTGEVIFPLPPISLGAMMMSDWNLPEDRSRENLVGFSVTVEGQPMPFKIDRLAVIEPVWSEDRPLSAQYDTPGQDVTALLQSLDIPLSLDVDLVVERLGQVSAKGRAALLGAGAIEVYGDGSGGDEIVPNWSIVLRHHWTQTFPAGADLRILHRYENRPSGGIFVWRDPPSDDWLQQVTAQYCIDAGTSAAIMKRLKGSASSGEDYVTGMAWNIAYVLRTANSWAGPIGRFRLTLDKGAVDNVISLCASGIKKTGPTTFVMEKQNFTPQDDLAILVVQPLGD